MIAIGVTHTYAFAGTTHNIYHANKGEGLPAHDHIYAHATSCHSGSIVVRKEGKEVVFTKITQPAVLVAAEWHEIEALEDGTVFENVFME
jgi:hypothetical protein